MDWTEVKKDKIHQTENYIWVECIAEIRKNDKYKTDEFERIGYPVKIHNLERCGMKYLIASGTYGESGVDIINLTLDSLMVEHYKSLLNLQ